MILFVSFKIFCSSYTFFWSISLSAIDDCQVRFIQLSKIYDLKMFLTYRQFITNDFSKVYDISNNTNMINMIIHYFDEINVRTCIYFSLALSNI